MIRTSVVLGIARAEARLTRRLARYWVFASVASLLGIVFYLYYGALHYFLSAYSPTIAAINPRYLVGAFGFYYLAIYAIGLVFLGFDIRARDRRERMAEVLDALPVSNVEVLTGRFLGLILMSWIPLVATAVVIFVIGWFWGEPVETWSLVGFVTVDTVPAFAFVLALTYLVTLAVRHRGLATVVLLALLVGIGVAGLFLPIWLNPIADLPGTFGAGFPSEILPVIAPVGWTQRLGVLLLAVALLGLASAIHPRIDDGSRSRRALASLGVLLLGALAVGSVAAGRKAVVDARARWSAAHAARASDPAPDVIAVTGSVEIDPGRRLALDLDVAFAAPPGVTLRSALFTLNPGLEVREVSRDGAALPFTFSDGLLEIPLERPPSPSEAAHVRIRAEGTPDERFAYLEAVIAPLEVAAKDAQIALLGTRPAIFDRRYVALMPAIRWLPTSGVEHGRGDPRIHPADPFTLDLTVDVPDDVTVVLPGVRADAGGAAQGRVRYRFASGARLTDPALLASRFVTREAEIDDVRFEVLVAPEHEASLELFDDAGTAIRDWISSRLEDARAAGLDYPYGALRLVEVPNPLRGFGGGWRLGSTFAPAGAVLMRESAFPTARFDPKLDDPKALAEHEGGAAGAKLEWLERFFSNDFMGGNLYASSAKQLFTERTAATGREAVALEQVFDELAARLATGKYAYFSAFVFSSDLNQLIGAVVTRYFAQQGQVDVVRTVIDAVSSKPEVWDVLGRTSLGELDPSEHPATAVDVLTLKCGAMAASMLDGLGREEAGRLLGAIAERAPGGVYDREVAVEAGRAVGVDLEPWIELWIDQTALPGFTVERADAYRTRDGEDGSPRYQVAVTLVNHEAAAGFAQLVVRTAQEGAAGRVAAEPVRVGPNAAKRIGVVTSSPPESARVAPYLSLNREPFEVRLPAIDPETSRDEAPFRGAEPVAWSPPDDGSIVVDDLDSGFRAEDPKERSWWRLRGRSSSRETDAGLPVAEPGRLPTVWSRAIRSTAWGRYRHTVALIRKGEGEHVAVFETELPRAGVWDLEMHVYRPSAAERGRSQAGTWHLEIVDASGEREAKLDAGDAGAGWSAVGRFDMTAGEVRVELSDRTDGRWVAADAIRWRPAVSGAANGASR